MLRFILLLLALTTISHCGKDDPPPTQESPISPVEITGNVLVENLKFPWELVWGQDNHIWMTERNGKISRIDPSNGNISEVFTISDAVSQGEGGLLGMELHPNFPATPHVFVAYCYNKNNSYTEKICRYTYNGTTLTDPIILIDNIKAAGIHNGCRLLIKNEKLFITTGDASDQSLPQNISSLNGKILRINLDGSIPSDNPIAGSAIWSTGHRNAQGLAFAGDSLYSSEHGPDSDDEINIIHRASNYGWPDVKGDCDASEQSFCDTHKVIEPLIKWTPTIAVSGMGYYNSDSIPQWKNSLLVCTLKGSKLVQLKLNGAKIDGANEYLAGKYGRLRDICISPTGIVYACTSNGNNDKIIEIKKK